MAESKQQLLSFLLDDNLIAIPVSVVTRVVRAVEITPLGKAPDTIFGVIDYHGEIIPVMNLRKRLGFRETPVHSTHRLLIIHTATRKMALVVDEIREVFSWNSGRNETAGLIPSSIEATGIARGEDGLILIFDPETFLSTSDEIDLKNALKNSKKAEKAHD